MKKKIVGSESNKLSSGRRMKSFGTEFSLSFGPKPNRIGWRQSALAASGGSLRQRDERAARGRSTISSSTYSKLTEKQSSRPSVPKYQQSDSPQTTQKTPTTFRPPGLMGR